MYGNRRIICRILYVLYAHQLLPRVHTARDMWSHQSNHDMPSHEARRCSASSSHGPPAICVYTATHTLFSFCSFISRQDYKMCCDVIGATLANLHDVSAIIDIIEHHGDAFALSRRRDLHRSVKNFTHQSVGQCGGSGSASPLPRLDIDRLAVRCTNW